MHLRVIHTEGENKAIIKTSLIGQNIWRTDNLTMHRTDKQEGYSIKKKEKSKKTE